MKSNKEGDDATETSAYSGPQGQTSSIVKSPPNLTDGDSVFNILDSTLAERGGVKVFDQIETWCEIGSIRKDA